MHVPSYGDRYTVLNDLDKLSWLSFLIHCVGNQENIYLHIKIFYSEKYPFFLLSLPLSLSLPFPPFLSLLLIFPPFSFFSLIFSVFFFFPFFFFFQWYQCNVYSYFLALEICIRNHACYYSAAVILLKIVVETDGGNSWSISSELFLWYQRAWKIKNKLSHLRR